MRVSRIVLRSVMAHTETVVELPPSGVVAVTGPNGSGKSTLIEGVATGVWGKSLRSTPPWRDGQDGAIDIVTDAVSVSRTRSAKGRNGLSWSKLGSSDPSGPFDTPTKAQVALEEVVGDFATWRRTCVFSSADAMHFSGATDSERKRLLEVVLGLDRFDPALKACRADLVKAQARVSTIDRDIAVFDAKLSGDRARLSDAQRVLANAGTAADPAAAREQAARVSKMLDGCRDEIAEAEQRVRQADRNASAATSKLDSARRSAEFLRSDRCPTCGQAIPQDLRDQLRHAVEDAERVANAATTAARKASSDTDAVVVELRQEAQDLVDRRSKLSADAESATMQSRQVSQAQRVVAEVEKSVEAVERDLADRRAKRLEASRLAAELEACELVLGLRGVRAHVLGKTLSAIEAVANRWLAPITRGASVRIRPYSEKKTGGIVDSIAFEVHGFGGGHGYNGASGGERRKIDVALLLALSEVAQASRGVQGGTIFFDEVFDALDDDGVEGVSRLLDELARDRTVVVITHSDSVLGALRPVERLKVDAGTITTLRLAA